MFVLRLSLNYDAEPVKGDPPVNAVSISLATVQRGTRAVITRMQAADDGALRLRELGMGEGRTVCVLDSCDPMLCQIDQCRVGVARCLAAGIFVRPLAE